MELLYTTIWPAVSPIKRGLWQNQTSLISFGLHTLVINIIYTLWPLHLGLAWPGPDIAGKITSFFQPRGAKSTEAHGPSAASGLCVNTGKILYKSRTHFMMVTIKRTLYYTMIVESMFLDWCVRMWVCECVPLFWSLHVSQQSSNTCCCVEAEGRLQIQIGGIGFLGHTGYLGVWRRIRL